VNAGTKDSPLVLIAVLGLVCIVAGLALGLVYIGTEDRIAVEVQKAKGRALHAVHPDADRFEQRTVERDGGQLVYFEAYDKEGKLIGYACEGRANGYSSTIVLTVGLDEAMTTITGIDITAQQETPGLGANCVKGGGGQYIWEVFSSRKGAGGSGRGWQDQFSRRGLDLFTQAGKTYKGVKALTGATITTNAVVRAMWNAVDALYRARGLVLADAITAAAGKASAEHSEHPEDEHP
jgi:RnfABCDGE-type electron transport complex G subunit